MTFDFFFEQLNKDNPMMDEICFYFKNDENETEDLCVICITDPREILLLPCRHVAMCAECYEEVKERTRQCPICRANITAAINFGKNKKETNDVEIEIDNSL